MKCANCGKDFGNGVNCQYCGIDRVSGLANYNGYKNPEGGNSYDSSSHGGYTSSPKTTVCYACSEIIPADAEYCPYCRKKLYETCPKCRKTYSSQFENCPKCGTNKVQYYQELETADKERTIRDEAAQLRESSSSLTLYLFFFFVLVGVFSFLFFYFLEYMTTLWSWIIYILACAWGCPVLSGIIGEKVKDKKIEKWKQEHPNDPRCKYL